MEKENKATVRSKLRRIRLGKKDVLHVNIDFGIIIADFDVFCHDGKNVISCPYMTQEDVNRILEMPVLSCKIEDGFQFDDGQTITMMIKADNKKPYAIYEI